MPRKPDFTLDVKIVNQEAFTHDSVIRQPRTFKPQDVLIASNNISLVDTENIIPKPIFALAKYVMTDYFYLSYRTGLYNRQRQLWEMIAKVLSIDVYQVFEGVFKKKAMPIFDIAFCDYKKKPLIVATFVEKEAETMGLSPVNCLTNFFTRIRNQGKVNGIFAAYTDPFPEDVLEQVIKLTNGQDRVAHFESYVESVACPLNLLAVKDEIELVYPDLSKRTGSKL